jgi:hypothetical protein
LREFYAPIDICFNYSIIVGIENLIEILIKSGRGNRPDEARQPAVRDDRQGAKSYRIVYSER